MEEPRPHAVQMMILGQWEVVTECATNKVAQNNAAKLREWCARPIRVVDASAEQPSPNPNLSRVLDFLNNPIKPLGQ